MADEEYTTEDLGTVRRRRVKGVRATTWGDRSVTHSSAAEDRELEQDILREQTKPRPRQILGVGNKGF